MRTRRSSRALRRPIAPRSVRPPRSAAGLPNNATRSERRTSKRALEIERTIREGALRQTAGAPAERRGLCWTHYQPAKFDGATCAVPGCSHPRRVQKFCKGHYAAHVQGCPLLPLEPHRRRFAARDTTTTINTDIDVDTKTKPCPIIDAATQTPCGAIAYEQPQTLPSMAVYLCARGHNSTERR